MSGGKYLSGGLAAVLACCVETSIAAAPTAFDTWSVDDATISTSSICPSGFTCAVPVTGDGFFQRQITDEAGDERFQTIVTDGGALREAACYSPAEAPDDSILFGVYWPVDPNRDSGKVIRSSGDTVPPRITAPADRRFRDTAPALLLPLADLADTELPVISDDQTSAFDFSPLEDAVLGPLAPGRHTLTWRAMDGAGNQASAEQYLDILPSANFQVDQTISEGGYADVTVYLNGKAPEYPVRIPFSVSGSATAVDAGNDQLQLIAEQGDHNANDGVIEITSGTEGRMTFYVAADQEVGEADETIIFTMGEPDRALAGVRRQHRITITERAPIPALALRVVQDQRYRSVVNTGGGPIKVTAVTTNPGPWGSLIYDWSQNDNGLVGADCHLQSFYIDPSQLSSGLYRIRLRAYSPEQSDQASHQEWWLAVASDSEVYDSDRDGIPDTRDAHGVSHLIPGQPGGRYTALTDRALLNHYQPGNAEVGWSVTSASPHIDYPMLIATEPGLKLSAGATHLWRHADSRGVALSWSDFNDYTRTFNAPSVIPQDGGDYTPTEDLVDPLYTPDNPIQNEGKHFMVSLEISHLPTVGSSARLVIPQAVAGAEGEVARVRSFTPAFGWQDFLEDHANGISSARREGDYCPPPGADQYRPGLITGFECLQIVIEDGGGNDADGYRNGRIAFNGGVLPLERRLPEPNGLAQEQTDSGQTGQEANTTSAAQGGPGGGGPALWLSALVLLGLLPKIKNLNKQSVMDSL